MNRAVFATLLAASTLVLSGCVTVVVDDNAVDDNAPVAEDLDNRTEASCTPGEDLLLNNPSTLYTVTGPCESITVEGTDLIVRVEEVDSLVLRGDRLLVEAGEIGDVEINGQDNVVAADSVEKAVVNGDRNSVSSDEPIDDADVNGNDNEVD